MLYSVSPYPENRALITAPTVDVISVANVKLALGITTSGQDNQITAALAAVVANIDPATGGWLGRALRPQTWELRLPSFYHHRRHRWQRWPSDAIELPYPPLISITSVKYDDVAGVEQTLTAVTDYRTLGSGSKGRQAVAPAYGKIWPQARADAETVRIRFQCGYANSPDVMPAAITQAVVLGVRMLLSNTAQNLYVSLDQVEGVGEKRYIVSAAANELLTGAMENLLLTYRANE